MKFGSTKMTTKICPRCKKNELNPIDVMNAISRADNKTKICEECGTDEAMEDFFHVVRDLSWLYEMHEVEQDE
jgi:RNA polymerase subunit RPABC4/transcription elongation factor Spt4